MEGGQKASWRAWTTRMSAMATLKVVEWARRAGSRASVESVATLTRVNEA